MDDHGGRVGQKRFPALSPALVLALLLGFALRVALWNQLPRLGMIGDEAEYLAAANWLAQGRGFAWHLTYLWTRAPIYPLFLAAHLWLFGDNLTPIFISQTILSLLNVALVSILTHQVDTALSHTSRRRIDPASISAFLAAIYLPFASYSQLLLSETLFTTLLLGLFVVLGVWAKEGKLIWVAIAGLLLGLATLTRGLTLGFFPFIVGWVVFNSIYRMPQTKWMRQCAIFIVAFCTILLPWTLYASRTYGGLVVTDTTGAFNLALGARTAYDGGRSDAPLRNFVLALLDPTLTVEERRMLLADARGGSCLYAANDPGILLTLDRPVSLISQAERQKLLSAEALCLLRAAPGAFVQKSLIELIDLFQINYTGDERLSKGFALGRLPGWYTLALFALDDTLYVLSLPLAVLGWAMMRIHTSAAKRPSTLVALLGLWLLYNLGSAPLLFAINRFRIPLMPLVFLLAGVALANLPHWRGLRSRYGIACTTLASLFLLLATTPYAYLEPRPTGEPGRWASYLGPYPSSVASTQLALATRPSYLAEERLGNALGTGDVAATQAALRDPALPDYAAAVGAPLLDGLMGTPTTGLDRLAQSAAQPLEGWQRSLVAGELLRQMGDIEAARREFSPPLVDDQNPVAWAWHWLHPPPVAENRINLADDNDLGYIRGFYLGRYDSDVAATVRWASGESALRFPAAANGEAQQLCLHITGLGWPSDLTLPTISAYLDEQLIGSFVLTHELHAVCLDLPATPSGSDITITLRSATFIPDALDLVRQQGPQVGQLRQLAYQLDWAEVR